MNADQFSFQQSAPGSPRGDRELSASDMIAIVDSLDIQKSLANEIYYKDFGKYFLGDSSVQQLVPKEDFKNKDEFIITGIIEKVRSSKNFLLSSYLRVDYLDREIDKFMVEIHKKYSIPAACLVFILLGAPLGVMIRKGGFGMSASVSLFFFLIYWASLIGGEKLADRAIISPFLGMWAANILMTVLGIILTVRVAKENIRIEFVWLQKLIPKNWRTPVQDENENP
jgi:lipopolysaccharide export system permease protein